MKPTHTTLARPQVFYCGMQPFIELHMLVPGERTSTKTRVIRLERTNQTEAMLKAMAEAGRSE